MESLAQKRVLDLTLDELLAEFQRPELDTGSVLVHDVRERPQEEPQELRLKLSGDQIVILPWEHAIYSLIFRGRNDNMRGPKPRPSLFGVLNYFKERNIQINLRDSKRILERIESVGVEIEQSSRQTRLNAQQLTTLRLQAAEAEQMLRNLAAICNTFSATESISRFATLGQALQEKRPAICTIFPGSQQHFSQQSQCKRPTQSIPFWKKVMSYIVPGYYAKGGYNTQHVNHVKITINTLLLWPFLFEIAHTAAQYTHIAGTPHAKLIMIAPTLVIAGLFCYGINKICSIHNQKKYS